MGESWPGLDDTDDELYYNVGKMRAVADDLEVALAPTQGAGGTREGVTGSVESLNGYFSLDESHIGRWPAASAFAASVSTLIPDRSTYGPYYMGSGHGLAQLYQAYVECCQEVVQAIRESADVYERTNPPQADAGE
ncbi:hypothetical protein E1267_30100 [Nonomuraea longispora]|uniref:Uncharacterized protein n=1 Tax=Nonomuraea longispora TaxID=1848320 RepID=A0A4R4N0E5_9ACTN|nr:hypothetical protein [Nonomuraea longispora]TDC02131.1 hypothetical protein E1267_30100 [Nonomuraea longispora]